MKNLLLVLYLFLAFLFGCASLQQRNVYPIINNYIGSTNFTNYKRIAVLPFIDAPNAVSSGQIIQGVACQVLGNWGFEVVERTRLFEILKEQKLSLSGLVNPDKTIKLGKLLGVKAIVVGEVGQYESHMNKTDTVYFPLYNAYSKQTNYIPIQGKQWMENFVSISLRVIDVETGQLLYSGSASLNQGVVDPPQQLAEGLINDIIEKWLNSPGYCGFRFNDNYIIEEVYEGTPAEKAGLMIGDKINAINGHDTSKMDRLDVKQRTYGLPGSKLILDIQRGYEIKKIELIRIPRENE